MLCSLNFTLEDQAAEVARQHLVNKSHRALHTSSYHDRVLLGKDEAGIEYCQIRCDLVLVGFGKAKCAKSMDSHENLWCTSAGAF